MIKPSPSQPLPLACGWWGKLPSRGDFVGRGLPSAGQQTWDKWLQRSLGQAARQLGSKRLGERLRAMPLWHFVVLPRRRGMTWCGAVLASRDRVGRAFPLLLAEGYASAALLEADVSALRSRAKRLTQALHGRGEAPEPADVEAHLAELASTPLTGDAGGSTPCRLEQLRAKSPAAASFWWCVEPPSDARYPYAEPWPPQDELLYDLLGID